ncbi:MAG: MlaD family protein [Geminocystis sp.]|nr:MlaD family protein [Geminocystis sp.]MCS7148726.1 MlaD family protein [Geminocystis sp.]MCX8078400.1 MlaD family protein [Geminocystis sp.]MDW8116125.1 MlaD family protein [Geminocystis sp.]
MRRHSRLFREGLIGLFLLAGLIAFGMIIFFLRQNQLRGGNYQLKLLFDNAGGLREGARVLYRGVVVGRINTIQPTASGVEVLAEIDRGLAIPKNVEVSTTRSGLLGEVNVNITPLEALEGTQKVGPLDEDCKQKGLILCNGQEIAAKASPDFTESLARLAEGLDNQKVLENLNQTILKANKALDEFTLLSKEVTKTTKILTREMESVAKSVNENLEKLGKTANVITTTAQSLSQTTQTVGDTANTQLQRLGSEYGALAIQLKTLTINVNKLINDNKNELQKVLGNVAQLTETTNSLLSRVEGKDVARISKNLSQISDNLVKISNDLTTVSAQLNNPATLVTLQQTLDSARVTFANTAKITSDIEEFTGDPQFKRNLRRLIDGLSNLVSYTDLLEKQVELAITLQQLEKNSFAHLPLNSLTVNSYSQRPD